ncbi:MAG: 1-acyl-sn-glycerol-3-phosphate acyltransferase [Oscillospiraceae bacterium]|nr:1-acyl-sn-glycerol-3-phosphate acyltransferase [Oscillospiraceae bacterium]
MKIKTKTLPYEEVLRLPHPAHKPPQRPNPLLRATFRLATAGDLKSARFTYRTERMDAVGDGPYLILMNHSSFIDLEIAAEVFRKKPYCIVCTSDGFVGKEGVMRGIGCIPTNKFVTDVSLIADMRHALREERCSVLLYPEASYSFDGRATPLPRRLGVMLKRLDVPVVGVLTEGAFARDPLYNCLQKRDVAVSATVRGLLTRQEIAEKSVAELDAILDGMFSFDNFTWQEENHIEINEPFRADGLHRILYKCAHCGAEGETEGKGTRLVCRRCGKAYELDALGRLCALDGETEFPHIPDWYAWEREEVRREIEAGTYRLDAEVDIGMLVDFKAIYKVGSGRLVHDADGFTLRGCGGRLHFTRPAKQCYSLYADYYWYELGDMICIGDAEAQYYCFPNAGVPVAKARLATEELYKRARRGRKENL